MAESERRTISAGPLQSRLSQEGRGAKAEFARKMNLESQAVVTNWLRRGVPLHKLKAVCKALDISEDRYRFEAGETDGHAGQLSDDELIRDIESLPPGLREYIARKARELREVWDKHPILRTIFTPPKNGDSYKAWEREIDALMFKLRDGGPEDE